MTTAKHLNACIYVVKFSYADSDNVRRKCKAYVAATSPNAFEEVANEAHAQFPNLFQTGIPGLFVPRDYQVDSVKLCLPLGLCGPGLPAYQTLDAPPPRDTACLGCGAPLSHSMMLKKLQLGTLPR